MPWMIDMDGADHSKRRRLVSGGFTPARVRAMEPQLRGDLRRPRSTACASGASATSWTTWPRRCR